MIQITVGTFIGLLLTLTPPTQALGICKSTMKPGEICEIDLQELHPTQLHVGHRQFREKAKELKAMDPDSLTKYLTKRSVPLVIGPSGFFMIDRHHQSRAVYEIGQHKVVATIKHNWRIKNGQTLSDDQFWIEMAKAQYVWLKNAVGDPISHKELQRYLWNMSDDPYRSLSGKAEDEGAFIKGPETYFIEFKWALFFRQKLKNVDLSSDSGFKDALKRAIKLAHSPEASHMPGYTPKRVKNSD